MTTRSPVFFVVAFVALCGCPPKDSAEGAGPAAPVAEPSPRPSEAPPPSAGGGVAAPSVQFGHGAFPARYRQVWGSRLEIPLVMAQGQQKPKNTTHLTVERGAAAVELLSGDGGVPTGAKVTFERVEQLQGPAESLSTTVMSMSGRTTVATRGPLTQVVVDKKPADADTTARTREVVEDVFAPDPFTAALRQRPVAVGEGRQDLAIAFAQSFAARDALRGGPKLFHKEAAATLDRVDGDRATFSVGVNFTENDGEMMMRAKLEGQVVVDVGSAVVVHYDLTGPVQIETRGAATGTTSGTWAEQGARELR